MDDGVGPFAIDVEVVGGGVEIPRPHPGGSGTDLREVQTLGTGEPLHVRRRRADAECIDDPLAEVAQLSVAGGIDPVRRDELR